MKETDILMLFLIVALYAAYNLFATIIISHNPKLSKRTKLITIIFTWIIPVMAGIIIIQRYYPTARKQKEKTGKKKKNKNKKKKK